MRSRAPFLHIRPGPIYHEYIPYRGIHVRSTNVGAVPRPRTLLHVGPYPKPPNRPIRNERTSFAWVSLACLSSSRWFCAASSASCRSSSAVFTAAAAAAAAPRASAARASSSAWVRMDPLR
jgi:hypothetical protein